MLDQDDTGVSNTDRITANHTPTFVGTGDAGSLVRLTIKGLSNGASNYFQETLVDALGNWSIAISTPLNNGSYRVYGQSRDATGVLVSNTSPSSYFTIVSAPVIPTNINLNSNSDSGVVGDYITKYNSIIIEVNGYSNEEITLFSSIHGVIGKIIMPPSQIKWSLPVSLSSTTHTITAVSTNSNGDVSAVSQAVQFVVDNNISTPTLSTV